jgi:hypothetical protein
MTKRVSQSEAENIALNILGKKAMKKPISKTMKRKPKKPIKKRIIPEDIDYLEMARREADKDLIARAMQEYDEPEIEKEIKYIKKKKSKRPLSTKEAEKNVRAKEIKKLKQSIPTCKVGNRVAVWNGSARQTSGGLKKSDLMLNKDGKIVSKKQSRAASIRFGK